MNVGHSQFFCDAGQVRRRRLIRRLIIRTIVDDASNPLLGSDLELMLEDLPCHENLWRQFQYSQAKIVTAHLLSPMPLALNAPGYIAP